MVRACVRTSSLVRLDLAREAKQRRSCYYNSTYATGEPGKPCHGVKGMTTACSLNDSQIKVEWVAPVSCFAFLSKAMLCDGNVSPLAVFLISSLIC